MGPFQSEGTLTNHRRQQDKARQSTRFILKWSQTSAHLELWRKSWQDKEFSHMWRRMTSWKLEIKASLILWRCLQMLDWEWSSEFIGGAHTHTLIANHMQILPVLFLTTKYEELPENKGHRCQENKVCAHGCSIFMTSKQQLCHFGQESEFLLLLFTRSKCLKKPTLDLEEHPHPSPLRKKNNSPFLWF